MQREIEQQPTVLAENSPRYGEELRAALQGFQPEMVLIAARGSSDHAALYARYLIEVELGIPVSLAAPSVLTRYHRHVSYPRCLAIGISQSGAAPDVSEVLESLREAGHRTLAITNTAGSRITRSSDHSMLLGVGEETSIAATKTYTASLLALYHAVVALGGKLADPILPTEEWVEACREAAESQSGLLVRSEPLFALGRGYAFATAHETALKLMECALLPCKAYSVADFHHGPKALAGPTSAAIAYSEAEVDMQTVVPPRCPAPETMKPWHEIIFGQWLALGAARARGLDPDHVSSLSKVTRTR